MLRTRSDSVEDSVRLYLKRIGKTPLLTHEQEIMFSKQVKQLMDLKQVKAEFGFQPSIQEWADWAKISESELERAIAQGTKAKEKMIEANLRLVVSVAKKYQNRNLELLDLIQEGNLGLEHAVEKFDPARNCKFSTYAYWWIRQAITRAIAQQARTIRLPVHLVEKNNKIKKAQRQLAQRIGRTATITEIALELNETPEAILKILDQSRQPASLDLRVGEDEDITLGGLVECDGPTPGQHLEAIAQQEIVFKILESLEPREKEVISLVYGLKNGIEMNRAQIGRRLNISRERVRQIEIKAFGALQDVGANYRSCVFLD